MTERIAIVGLGYVGLPVALAFAAKFPGVIGFDISARRVEELTSGLDRTRESSEAELRATNIRFTSEPEDLAETTFWVVAVPTPVDSQRAPDLSNLISASEMIGAVLRPGACVVYESTVYPGVTEEICGPILERVSGLRRGVDFTLGYSPERINPGDKTHTLQRVVKVVAGEDATTLDRVAATYGAIIDAGVHRAPTIGVAEAAKVVENTQRDLNIALVNELALIFDRLNISTRDVLAAAGTKWNFLKFWPGLVGGHCIGVDPYYLTARAESVGFHPEVILAGRRINDGMGRFLAQRMVKLLINSGKTVTRPRVGVMGITFKEDVADIRNSRAPEIAIELKEFGIDAIIHDPIADPAEVDREYGLKLSDWDAFHNLDGLILAVAHEAYGRLTAEDFGRMLATGGVLMDVKSRIDRETLPAHVRYWAL